VEYTYIHISSELPRRLLPPSSLTRRTQACGAGYCREISGPRQNNEKGGVERSIHCYIGCREYTSSREERQVEKAWREAGPSSTDMPLFLLPGETAPLSTIPLLPVLQPAFLPYREQPSSPHMSHLFLHIRTSSSASSFPFSGRRGENAVILLPPR